MTMREVEAGKIVDDRYRIESHVGSGGMADVYAATDQLLGRKVALKLLYRRFAQDPEFVERFRREASSAAGLQHPNVVSVYDRGEWEGTYYIAMEFLEGSVLKELVREHGALEPELAIDIAIQILRAARFAHRRGIIHRDLKPHNVIVDEEGRAKVTDFGIARAGASDMTETGSIMGTAQYLSPEQAQGSGVSAQSDLYSIGIVLYELLVGHVPFDADSAVTIALKQVSEAPVPPSELNPAASPALQAVVLRALEKEPAARYADAEAFIAALEAVRDGAAAPVPPPMGNAPAVAAVPVADPAPASDGAWTGAYAPPPAEDERRERQPWWRRWWPWLLVALALLAIGFGLFLALRPAQVTVPDVAGMKSETAAAKLANEGLDYEISSVPSERVESDRVIRQDPAAGREVDEDSTVELTVSSGPGRATVPTVFGQPKRRAVKTLRDAGFEVRTEERASDRVEQGQAIGTEPDAGTQTDKTTTVVLFISTGPATVEVPDLSGQSADSAEAQLSRLGLEVGSLSEEESDDVDPGTVIGQSVEPGADVERGSAISLTIAEEPSRPEIPDVAGSGRNSARSTLRDAGFEVDVRQVETDDRREDGRVISQQPGGGERRSKGATVRIDVGKYVAPEPEASPTPTPAP